MMMTCPADNLSAGIISIAVFFSVIAFTSLPTNMQYVVLHITFSQSIMKITETEKRFKNWNKIELKWIL